MSARRKTPHPFVRGASSRTLTPASTASRLPSVAAVLSALAIVTSAADAHAIVRTSDAGADEGVVEIEVEGDAATDADPDATYCDPRGDIVLGGVPMPTRVHGTGCGCGASGDDDSSTAALLGTAMMIGAALARKRRD